MGIKVIYFTNLFAKVAVYYVLFIEGAGLSLVNVTEELLV
jgi:hypothetical protein